MTRYDGFREFILARGPALSRTAYLLTGDHHSAEELLQSALVKTAAHWPRVRSGGNPDAYVRRVMVNDRTSAWRRRSRYSEELMATLPEQEDAADNAGASADRIALRAALRRLAPKQRSVLVLRYFEDLSEAECADILNCSIGTIKHQTHDALKRLRDLAPDLAFTPKATEVGP